MKRFLIAIYCLIAAVMSSYSLTISHLRVESQINPAIDGLPHFSWQLESNERGCEQHSYQIRLYADVSLSELIYDSGIIESSESQHVLLKALSLLPSTRYYWVVTVTDNLGNESSSDEKAYFDTGLMTTGWSGAEWIMYPEEGNKSTGMPRFRKITSLNKAIKNAYIYSSALGIYDLTINGQRVGHYQPDNKIVFDELKPGWTDFRKFIYYNVHEITPYLQNGANVIGADVTNGWWNGGISWGLYGDYPLGFISKIVVNYEDGSNEIFITDNSWKVTLDGPYRLGDIYDGEIYDARKDDNWQSVDYNDDNWKPAVTNSYCTGELTIQKAGQVRILESRIRPSEKVVVYDGIQESETDFGMIKTVESFGAFHPFTLIKGNTAVFDFGQNMVGYVRIRFKAAEGTEIRLRYAEMLNDTGSKDRGNDGPGGSLYLENLRTAKATSYYYCKGEVSETYCPVMTYYGFRYCDVIAGNDLEIESIEALPISSVFDEVGNVSTNNSSLNQLFSNIMWGQLGNFVSVPTDCPQRNERWGWTGDTQVFSRTGMYNTNSEAFYRKFLADLRDCQREDGSYPDVAPYTWGRGYGHAGWSDAGIIIPWNLYLMYGNIEILQEHYDSMERYMGWLSNNHNDGITHAGPDTDYGDWLAYDECDKRYLSVAYYANDAMLMSKMSKVLSQSESDVYAQKAHQYLSLFNDIKEEFNEVYWNPEPQNTAQSTYLLPLAFELLDGDKKNTAIFNLREAIQKNGGLLSTGFLGTSIFLPTLSKVGLNDEAYSLVLQRGNPSWLYCIDQGATTIWERWDSYTLEKGFGPASMNSFNHYSYGAVGEWYYRYIAGIEADESSPGFKHFCLKPVLDLRDVTNRITKVEAIYYTNYGVIQSAYNVNDNGSYQYSCEVPANTKATLYLPLLADKEERLENKVQKDNAGEYAIYELESGAYMFKVEPSSVTNISNINNNSRIVAYNSLTKELRVETGDAKEIIIYNINGNKVTSYNNCSFVNIDTFPKGIYILNIIKDTIVYKFKLVKK